MTSETANGKEPDPTQQKKGDAGIKEVRDAKTGRFLPGNVTNPRGRPPKLFELRSYYGEVKCKAIADKLFVAAIEGDTAALKEAVQHIFGKPRELQPSEQELIDYALAQAVEVIAKHVRDSEVRAAIFEDLDALKIRVDPFMVRLS